MRVLVVWPRWDPASASGVRGHAFVRAWREAGAEVAVVTDMGGRPDAGAERLPLFVELGELRHLPATRRRLRAAIRRHRPDVVVTSTPLPTLAWSAVRAARAERVPVVVDVRDLSTESLRAIGGRRLRYHALERIERAAYRGADALLATTARMRDELARRYGVAAARVHVAENGHDFPARLPAARPSGAEVVFLGYVLDEVVRRPYDLLDALADVHRQRPATRLALVGWKDGSPAAQRVRAHIAKLGLGGAIDLEPPVPHGEVPARLRQAKVAVLPLADRAVFRTVVPAKLYEYLAAGLPVAVLGPSGGSELQDLVESTGCGTFSATAEGFAADLLGLLADSRRRAACAKKALAAAPRFRRDEVARRVLDEVLRPLAARGRGA